MQPVTLYNLKMSTPPLWVGAVAAYPDSAELRQRYTVPGKYDENDPMQLWHDLGDGLLGLPWNCCPASNDNRRVDGRPIALKFKGAARNPQQGDCMEAICKHLRNGRSFVYQAPAGSGKTVCAIKAICETGVTTVVIVPKDDLVDQWIERIVDYTGLPIGAIGRIQGDVCEVMGYDIVIASLKSICKANRYPAWIYTYFGLMIVDEVHKAGADQMGEVLKFFYARRRLGLSATPTRKDGKDLLIEAHIGPILVTYIGETLQAKILIMKTNWKVPRYRNGDLVPHTPGRIALILPSLCNNGPRNLALCKVMQASREKGRRVVCFSERVEHLEMLETMMGQHGTQPYEIGRYYGATAGAALKKAGTMPLIFATPGKMAEGTDIPELDTLVLASPRADIEQILGRILREHPTKKPPVCFDFVDEDSRVLAGYAMARQKFYKLKGHEVKIAALPMAA